MRWYIIVLFIILLFVPTALASEAVGSIDIPHIVLSLAIMLLAAKIGGEVAERKSSSLRSFSQLSVAFATLLLIL